MQIAFINTVAIVISAPIIQAKTLGDFFLIHHFPGALPRKCGQNCFKDLMMESHWRICQNSRTSLFYISCFILKVLELCSCFRYFDIRSPCRPQRWFHQPRPNVLHLCPFVFPLLVYLLSLWQFVFVSLFQQQYSISRGFLSLSCPLCPLCLRCLSHVDPTCFPLNKMKTGCVMCTCFV